MNFKSLIIAAFFVGCSLTGFTASDAFLEGERDRADQLFVSIAASLDRHGNPRGENDRIAKIEKAKSEAITILLKHDKLELARDMTYRDVAAWKRYEKFRDGLEYGAKHLADPKYAKNRKTFEDLVNHSAKCMESALKEREKIWLVK